VDVTVLWNCTSDGVVNFDPKGVSQPVLLGDIPPVTIRPVPAAARSA